MQLTEPLNYVSELCIVTGSVKAGHGPIVSANGNIDLHHTCRNLHADVVAYLGICDSDVRTDNGGPHK